jgi:ferric-dicitrate binding protein FerR (iron transport regulator)
VKKRLTRAEVKARQRKAQRRWRAAHPNYNKEWQAANRDYVTQQKRKYRERKKYGNEI